MRILLLSVTAGGGHNSAAAALREALEAAGHQVLEADLYRSCAGNPAGKLVDGVYRFAAAHLRRHYHKIYSRLEQEPDLRRRFLRLAVPAFLSRRLHKLVLAAAPDRVIATHVFAAYALSRLPAEARPFPLDGVVTDYCLHPLWEDCRGLRSLSLASPDLREEAIRRGVAPAVLVSTGIPIRAVFSRKPDRTLVRQRLGLLDKPTLLLMGGSMGYGGLFRTALHLRRYPALQTVCICGTNRRVRLLLRPYAGPGLQVLGYTSQMADYMAAADLAVTKPGGLSLAELAAAGLPSLLTRPIPGHEERNRDFMRAHGCASVPPGYGPRETAAAAAALLADSDKLAALRAALESVARPAAAADLVRMGEFQESLDKVENHDRITLQF